ncbi:MAG: hypothetical protein Pg6C_19010 [Treponemataceae bacterium]|nr:MAG: hypothetical protein Pg6C_18700 [Treponemataceae bacterium]GMO52993.1 MAG: hypothetical protein Pg6C_19010 [Treponemataceae bacterium]
MNGISAKKSALLKTAQDYDDGLAIGIKTVQKNVNNAILAINEYIQSEKQRNEALAAKINSCNVVFEKIEDSAARILKNTEFLNKKLFSASAAFGIADNLDEMLKDINTSFSATLNDRSIEIQKQIQRILDRLIGVAHQCAHFQSFPKPYKDLIDLYCVKIESVFSAFTGMDAVIKIQPQTAGCETVTESIADSRQYYLRFNKRESGPFGIQTIKEMIKNSQITNDYYFLLAGETEWKPVTAFIDDAEFSGSDARNTVNPAWNYHYKTGRACVFITPERAIIELTEAIRLNPEYARQYYFRGMAYRRKKEPNFHAALKDFEKAYFLSPDTDEYISAVEDVKSEIDAKNAEVIKSWND